MSLSTPLISSTTEEFKGFGERTLFARHNLHELNMFADEAVAELLDRHPRNDLQVITMGLDPTKPDWRQGDPGDLTGAELVAAVKKGRFWLNVKRVDVHHKEYRSLIKSLYDEIAARVPGFEPIWTAGTLLISSPGAMVFYHLDAVPNLLWHIRGTKRLWVYPVDDNRLVSHESLSRIIAGEADEELHYEPSFDQFATTAELHPGEFASWKQNSPHRVVNMDSFNISLSTEFLTTASRRRINVFRANRILGSGLAAPLPPGDIDGIAGRAKELFYYGVRAVQKLGGKRQVGHVVPVSFQVDLSKPGCVGISQAARPE